MLAWMLCRLFVGICHQSYKQPFCRQIVKQWLQILTWQTHTCLFCIFEKSPVFSFSSFFLLKFSNRFKFSFPSIEPQIWLLLYLEHFSFPLSLTLVTNQPFAQVSEIISSFTILCAISNFVLCWWWNNTRICRTRWTYSRLVPEIALFARCSSIA